MNPIKQDSPSRQDSGHKKGHDRSTC